MITPELRLLDDLNLDSIKAAELIAEATKKLGIMGDVDPSEHSNSTLSDISNVLAQVYTQKARTSPGSKEASETDIKWKYKSWVRNFITQYTPQEMTKKAIKMAMKTRFILTPFD